MENVDVTQLGAEYSPCRNYCTQVGRCLLTDIAVGRADIEMLRTVDMPAQQLNAEYFENPAWRQTYGDLIGEVNQDIMDDLNSPFALTLNSSGEQVIERSTTFEISENHPIFGYCDAKRAIGVFGVSIVATSDATRGLIAERVIAVDIDGEELDLDFLSDALVSWHEDYFARAIIVNNEALQSISSIRSDVVVNQYNWLEPELEKGSIETYVRPIESDNVRNDGDIWDCTLEIHEFFTVKGDNSFNQVDDEKFIDHSVYLGHRYRDADLSDMETAEFDEDSNWLSLGVRDEQDSPEILFESREEMQKFIELAVELVDVEQRSEEFFVTLCNQAAIRGIVFEAKT